MAGENRSASQPVDAAGALASQAAEQAQADVAAARESLAFQMHEEPWRFSFYQAARRLECGYQNLPRIGASQKPGDDAVRFCQEPSLAFPPSTVAAFDMAAPDRPARMYVNFLGMLGPNGPLPLHITEYARQRMAADKDPTLARFLDVMNHRLVSLFYRAWAVNQQTVSFDRSDRGGGAGGDRFAMYIASLFGLGMENLRDRDAAPDPAKLHYSGRFVDHTRCAEGLQALVQDYFGIQTDLIQFVGQWIDLPPDSRCKLGESRDTGVLGSTAIVGSRIWQCQYKFRLRLGPMTFAEYERLLPGGRSLQRLVAWVRNYLGQEMAWDVQLVLRKEEVPACQMGKVGRLGWSTWMKSRPTPRDAEDLILTACA